LPGGVAVLSQDAGRQTWRQADGVNSTLSQRTDVGTFSYRRHHDASSDRGASEAAEVALARFSFLSFFTN